MDGLTYPERRAKAIALAAAYDGWGRPPNPEGQTMPPRLLSAVLAKRLGKRWAPIPEQDRYGNIRLPWSLRLDGYFEAKEKNQNRERFN